MPLSSGLNGLYHVNNDFLDSSGSPVRDMTNVGIPFETVSPILGAASADPNGIDDHAYASIGAASGDTEGQIAFWYKSSQSSGDHSIVVFDNGSNSDDLIGIRILNGTLDFIVKASGVEHIRGSITLPTTNQKHAVIFGVASGGNSLLVDNVLQSPAYVTGDASTSKWLNDGGASFIRMAARMIGVSPSTYYGELIDELAWSNRVWTSGEKTEYWNDGNGIEIGIEEGIVILRRRIEGY